MVGMIRVRVITVQWSVVRVVQVVQVIQVIQVVQVVRMVSLDDRHSETIWFSW